MLIQTNFVERFYTKSVRQKLLLIQYLLLFVPLLQFFSIQTDNGAIPASLCYFFSLVFVPCLLVRLKDLRLPPWYITGLYGWVFFIAVLRISQYGLSKSILHWAFGFYLLIIVLNVGGDFTKEEWHKLLETAFCLFAVTHFLFTVTVNGKLTVALLDGYFNGTTAGNYGFRLRSLTRGGRNLDATWLGLGSFFVHGKKKAVYVTWAILFAFLGSSRVGVIAIVLAILWSLIYDERYRLRLKNLKWYIVYAVAMLIVLFGSGMAQKLLARNLLNIPSPRANIDSVRQRSEEDSSSATLNTPDTPDTSGTNNQVYWREFDEAGAKIFLSGRAAMWSRVPEMARANLWGYGVGNAMRVMKSQYGFSSYEDVVHNVFFQWLLDEGLIGGLWYLGLVIMLFITQWKKRPACFADPFAGYFFIYIVLSLVQFHGGEALMIYVLGIALLLWNTKLICIRRQSSK